MKRITLNKQKYILLFQLSISILISSCAATKFSQFEVQRPSSITVPREVKKVFIRTNFVDETNDKLSIKSQLLEQLAKELNRFERFKVIVINTLDEAKINTEKETIAIIQGEVISGGELDRGQFTDIATCTGGLGGRLSSATAAAISDETVTLDSWKGYICRRGAFTSNVTEMALSSAFAMAGLNEVIPPKNQVIRTYKYKNISLFAQANLSFTIIGQKRETLAIRADSSSFGRSITEKDSYSNVKESHLISQTLGSLISFTRIPIFSIPIREVALAELSNPKQKYHGQKRLAVPGIYDLPSKEKEKIIQQLVKQTLKSFIRTISPYKIMVSAEVASGGQAEVGDLLKDGKPHQARKIIEDIPPEKRDSQDWYNLGLTYEASAVSPEDYEDARRFYITALENNPGSKLYALGVGRTRLYLAETRRLAKQIQD